MKNIVKRMLKLLLAIMNPGMLDKLLMINALKKRKRLQSAENFTGNLINTVNLSLIRGCLGIN